MSTPVRRDSRAGNRRALLRRVYANWQAVTFRASRPTTVCNIEVAAFLAPWLPGVRQGIDRVSTALNLISMYDPNRLARIQRDLPRIFVTGCAGDAQFLAELDMCLLRGDRILAHDITPVQIALLIVHEAIHARLSHLGIGFNPAIRARHELICTKAELAFALRLEEPERAWYVAYLRERCATLAKDVCRGRDTPRLSRASDG
jgi:hypothetical protein